MQASAHGGLLVSVTTRRQHRFWGVLVLVALIGVVVSGEILVRIARPSGVAPERDYEPGIYQPDAARGWALEPSYRGSWVDYEVLEPTSTNRLAYRGPEETPERLGAALKVVALGDSVTFGRGVADGEPYPDRLESLLIARGSDAAVFNLAVPGYDSTRERLTFEQHVDRIDPHVVVVGWYRNDVSYASDGARGDSDGVQVIDGHLVSNAENYHEFRRRMLSSVGIDRSMLLNFARVRWKLWRKGLSLERRRQNAREASLLEPSAYAGALAELNRIQAICLARGIEFVLVVHPALDELVLSKAPEMEILRTGVEQEPYTSGTTVLSVADAWRDGQPVDLYQPGDRCHPNARGHDSIARLLAALPVFAVARN